MRITSVTPMKDEGPFILEWIAYHNLIGINDFLVFSNDCTDGTDKILERLDELGIVRHLTNPSVFNKSSRHHWQAIGYVNTLARLKRSDWFVSFDVDEFICVNVGNGTLQALFEAVHGANVISFNQHNFGCGGVENFQDRLQIDQFEYAWNYDGAYNVKQARRGVKSLTHKSANAAYFANHSPIIDAVDLDNITYVNGSGRPLDNRMLLNNVKLHVEPDFGFDLVQLNHYALRSMESYLVQASRGNANHPDSSADMAYWRKYNHNDNHDTRIQRWSERVHEAVAVLRSDPELNDLHIAAVEFHKNQIQTLKTSSETQRLYRRIKRHHTRNPGVIETATS